MHRPKSCSGTTEVLSLIIIQISGNNMLSTLWALKNSLALCIHDGLITRSLIPIHDGLPHNSSTYHYSRRSLITVQLSLLLHHLFTTTVYDYCLRLLFTTTVYDGLYGCDPFQGTLPAAKRTPEPKLALGYLQNLVDKLDS